ncbi:MAG: hypothetical protein JNJ52_09770 [Flavobacterium sp.]|nr:hypothetical protein [Flavobacterium sp.]
MKKIKLFASVLFLISTFSLVSCDNEPIDSAIDLDNFTNDDGSGNGNGNGTSTGDYWPTALNNQWVYKRDGALQSPSKIISINAINGNTYYTFDSFISQSIGGGTASAAPTTRVRKSSGDYYYKLDDFNFNLGGGMTGVQTGCEFIILKDYLNVGQTWNGTYNQTTSYNNPLIPSITQTVTYEGTILEKDISITVNGETFPHVIKMELVQDYDYPASSGLPDITVSNDYWFAKDVGLVKAINTTSQGTSLIEIDSYILN